MGLLDDGVGFLFLLEERQECRRECKVADVINFELLLEEINVDTCGFREVKGALNASIEKDTVKIWVVVGHAAKM